MRPARWSSSRTLATQTRELLTVRSGDRYFSTSPRGVFPMRIRASWTILASMTTRQVDEAAERLHELRAQVVADLVLAAAAFGLALAASRLWPDLALPLLVGAIGVAFLGMRALVRRTFLVEDLAVERDAYAIPDVCEFGRRAASPEHRRELAHSVRVALTESSYEEGARLIAVREELEQLIAALQDDRLRWEPQAAVTLGHWLTDPTGSFRDPSVPVLELRSRLRGILTQLQDQ